MERADFEQWKGREVARLLALVETDRRYFQEIVAELPVALLVLSSELAVLSANRAARRLFGVRGAEAAGRLQALLPQPVLDRARQVIATGQPASGLMVEHESRRLRVSIIAIRNGDDEAEREALLSIEDLTAAGAPPLEILDSLNAVVWSASIPDMTFVFVSGYARELLGYDSEHWLTAPTFWADRVIAEDRDRVLRSYREAIEQKRRQFTCEFRSQTRDGCTIWLRETARVLTDDKGEPKHVVGLTVDITRQRESADEQIQSERMDALSRLASRLSHDLNNMLMIVTGYSEELLNHVHRSSPLRTDIQEIVAATDRIATLTNQLLAFTRRQAPQPETIDVGDLLASAERKIRDAAGSAIRVQVASEHGLLAKADPGLLEQLLAALATRARTRMPKGGELTIRAYKRESVVIEVQDTAAAISHEERAALFESFLDEPAAAISRAYTYIRQWGGSIAVSDDRISILLPAENPGPAPAPAPQKTEPAAAPATILIVEDEAGIRALVRKILRRHGYAVLEAANGEEALKSFADQARIDLLITDVMMPQMGGRQLAGQLKTRFPRLKVLYVSGYTDEPAIDAEHLPPDTAFLQKPFTLGSLLDKVREVLGPA